MPKNQKGMICVLNRWEWEEQRQNGLLPDCRNHRHTSRRRLYERSGQARFADRTLADVYDAQLELIGFIVEVAGRARWCEKLGNQGCKAWIDASSMETINVHLNRFQAMIEVGRRRFEVIKLPKWHGNKPGIPPRSALITETLKSHSPCGLTAKESEANAEAGWAARRAQRDQER
jgi:hypothetical protein